MNKVRMVVIAGLIAAAMVGGGALVATNLTSASGDDAPVGSLPAGQASPVQVLVPAAPVATTAAPPAPAQAPVGAAADTEHDEGWDDDERDDDHDESGDHDEDREDEEHEYEGGDDDD